VATHSTSHSASDNGGSGESRIIFRGYGPGPAIPSTPADARSSQPGPQITGADHHHQDPDDPADNQVRQMGAQAWFRAVSPASH
jgi:hypothetical protein